MTKSPARSKASRSPHDQFFKWIMAQPKHADRFIRERLPADIASLLGPLPPRPINRTFVDGALKEQLSDLLFAVPLDDGRDVLVYVLFEHKSGADRLTRFQLWRYMTRIWERWLGDGGRGALPLILPVVVHHGAAPWPYPDEFAELFGPCPGQLAPFVPHFRHALVDLVLIPDAELSRDPELQALLLVMKRIQQPDLERRIAELLVVVSVLDEMVLWTVLEYVSRRIGQEKLIAAAVEVSRHDDGDRMSTFKEFAAEYLQKRGRAEGKAEGKADTLMRLLVRRFGPLPEAARRRIEAADIATLDRWLDRVIDAPDLDGVLAGRRKRPG
jgi:predicted transposase/invertase (TIGR01784 family)